MTTHSPAPPASGRSARIAGSEAAALAGVVGLGIGCALNPATIDDGPVVCPFRLVTGLPCPGCGLTRSWVYLTHGWWRSAFEANPFGPVLALLMVGLAVAVVVARLRRRRPISLDALASSRWLRPVLAAWLLFAAVRIGVDLA